ncbi:FtsX-like permease family protein [Haladaptatus caseinilyticus]|uniref:FtsX-like permease family protein n=1 Tax=Haladaptatus caseinilyticus TaxID=2993314 RepID=UPI00224B944A|nr:FtsX-like permease family protein [Haladaptatus caseinilyticus]
MNYTEILLRKWSRRDQLAIVIVAVTVAFLVGTTLLLTAASAQSSAITGGENDSMVVQQYNSYQGAQQDASKNDIVFPTTTIRHNGTEYRVIGIPKNAPSELTKLSVSWKNATVPSPPSTGFQGPVSEPTRQRFHTQSGKRVTKHVAPYTEQDSIFPQTWYVGDAGSVRSLEDSGAFLVHTNQQTKNSQQLPQEGTLSPSLFAYFFGGMQQVLQTLVAATVAAGVLILVVIHNITVMSVRDRLTEIAVIRSTGGSTRRIIGIFALRAGIIALVGSILGYAIGVITIRALVNFAIFAGLSVSLDPTVTVTSTRILLFVVVFLSGAGTLAGAVATRSVVIPPPSQLWKTTSRAPPEHQRWEPLSRFRLRPQLLPWRTLIPATATLTVFALIVILSSSLVGALTPVATTSTGTVTEPGSPYPMASRIDAQYASELRNQGLSASPEIIVAQVSDGKPYLARGANYSAFASVSDTKLTKGHPPHTEGQAVIGQDLAQTLDKTTGDTIIVGGSTSPAVTQVKIVGVFRAPGILDDQLIIPLPTAHSLSTKPGTVHFIRTAGGTPNQVLNNQESSPNSELQQQKMRITSVSAPEEGILKQPIPVSVTIQNIGSTKRTRQVKAAVGDDVQRRSVTLQPGEETQVQMNLSASHSGNQTLEVGRYSQPIRVYKRSPLVLPILPEKAPPGSQVAISIQTIYEKNITGATVTIDGTTTTTNDQGIALVTLPNKPGTYELTARKGERTYSSQIQISRDASRRLFADIKVTPKRGSVYTTPRAIIRVANPWGVKLTRNISLVTPGQTRTQTRTVPAYNLSEKQVTLEKSTEPESTNQFAPGEYTIRVVSNGTTLASDDYVVIGDKRIQSTLAQNAEFSAGSGLGQAVEMVFGNFKLLLFGMIGLAGLTTIGSTTSTFAQVVHSRRQSIGIYRATGATRRQLLKLLLGDVVRIAIPASVVSMLIALGSVYVLSFSSLMTVFGVQLNVAMNPYMLIGVGAGALILSCIGVIIAVIPFLTVQPTEMQ